MTEGADLAVEAPVRERKCDVDASVSNGAVPTIQSLLTVFGIVVAQRLVERSKLGDFSQANAVLVEVRDVAIHRLELVIVVASFFLEAALDAGPEVVGRIRRRLGPEEVERNRVVKVDVFLQQPQVEPAEWLHIVGVVLAASDRAVRLHDSAHAGCAHEHVVRLLLQHEVTGA